MSRILIKKNSPEPYPWEYIIFDHSDPGADAVDYGSCATQPEALAAAWEALAEDERAWGEYRRNHR